MTHSKVAGGQPDDRGLVELRRDGGRQRQKLPELEELRVLLLATVPRRVLALVLHLVAPGDHVIKITRAMSVAQAMKCRLFI